MSSVRFLYDALLYLAFPFLFPWFAWRRVAKGKPFPDIWARLAFRRPPAPPAGARPVWIHAVSVGEVMVVKPLVEAILGRGQGTPVYLSATTATGLATARKLYDGRAVVFPCPFDLPGAVRRTLRRIRPAQVIVAETELWPNLIALSRKRGIPVSIVNGRISDEAFPSYRRARFFMKPFLGLLNHVLAQSETDAERFRLLGARPGAVTAAGNMKFDAVRGVAPQQALAGRLEEAFGAGKEQLLLLGSTTEGEEQLLLEPLARLAEEFPGLRFLVAPRHPERFAAVHRLFEEAGFAAVRRSALDERAGACRMVVLDTIGELSGLYFAADVVFVGGSLVPRGGHNILEPAIAARPVLVGPSMDNFREILDVFVAGQAVEVVPDAGAFADAAGRLLRDAPGRRAMGERALATAQAHQGATARCLAALFPPAEPAGEAPS